MTEQEKRIEKARNLRYKKAVAQNMNKDEITRWVYDTYDALSDVTFVMQNDDVFVDALGGDEEEAFEYRIAFQSLEGDIERFQEDLENEYIPECFDDFFCAVSGRGTQYAGYDTVEEDYYGLSSFEGELGQQEAEKRLERMTKHDMIEAAQRCYQIAFAYLGLKSRFEDLRAAVDIIRAKNDGMIEAIRQIEESYNRLQSASGFWDKLKYEKTIDKLSAILPEEVWIR